MPLLILQSLFWLIFASISDGEPVVSYNLPKLCPEATWDKVGIHFRENTKIEKGDNSIFITVNNSIYVLDYHAHKLFVWLHGDENAPKTLSVGHNPGSLFVTLNGDIYTGNGGSNEVKKWSIEASDSENVVIVSEKCFAIFIDIKNMLYCSVRQRHIVERGSLENTGSTFVSVVAGEKGRPGDQLQQLHKPWGIFVHINFSLYVADFGNNRVQRFDHGNKNGVTVIGKDTHSLELKHPAAIVLDGNDNLYIVDDEHHRVIRVGPFGFQCLLGCSKKKGTGNDQLDHPNGLAFDREGNIFVIHKRKLRVLKYLLVSNSCNITASSEQTMSSTTYTEMSTTNIAQSTAPPIDYNPTISFNRPRFCAFPSWNPDGITFADKSVVGDKPYGIFIDMNDTVYLARRDRGQMIVWPNNSQFVTRNMSGNLSSPFSVFVTSNGDIFVDNGGNQRVDVWSGNKTYSIPLVNVNKRCFGLFVDIRNNLYCSMDEEHQVARQALGSYTGESEFVAGTGTLGKQPNQLNSPRGIFVDTNFDLYVADCGNNRVQLFTSGNRTGTTVAGTEAPRNIKLNWPTAVTVDAAGYLFIVDENNHRIVGAGPYGYRCLVGCSRQRGSQPYQLNFPQTLAFDSQGNMFVTERQNNRVQKFMLASNSCALPYNLPKLSSCATWNPNGTSLAVSTVTNAHPYGLSITHNDSIYATDMKNHVVLIWTNDTASAETMNSSILKEPLSLFVSTNLDMFINNQFEDQIIKWTTNSTSRIPLMRLNDSCIGLFIDVNNNLYCSIALRNIVIRKSLYNTSENWTIVAGNGSTGMTSETLSIPQGIFVDVLLNLYVADGSNDRIQRFSIGETNGKTVAGNKSTVGVALTQPSGVTLDADANLFIVDQNKYRVVVQNSNGIRCLLGCSHIKGSKADQFFQPMWMNFDSHGNIFVVDFSNNRIQKFALTSNSCDDDASSSPSVHSTTLETTQASTMETHPIFASTAPHEPKDPSIFIAPTCSDPTHIGPHCNTTANICILANPCQNNGTCNSTSDAYHCACPPGFNGTHCELDHRPCKPHTCFFHGECNETSPTTFNCTCDDGWEGVQCQSMVNFCQNITCENNGVCRPLLRDYKCECLGEAFSGRHCEITALKTRVLQFVAKSFAFIVIIALSLVAAFVIVMDILKYGFGIDPVAGERERLRRERRGQRRRRNVLIQRFIYVNAPQEATH